MRDRWAAVAATALILSACSTAVSGRGQPGGTASRSPTSSPSSSTDIAPSGTGETSETTTTTDDAPPPETGPTSATDTALDGAWAGHTSQGSAVTFTVAEGSIARIAIAGRYGGAACPITGTEYSMTGGVDIDGRHFTVGPATGGGANIEGTFTSDRQANGTAEFVPDVTARDLRCLRSSVTWTAART